MSAITIGHDSLVALMGCSGSGKTSFAHRHFAPYQVLSSDMFRGMVADDENDQSATPDAFEILYLIAGKRLSQRRLTIVDATNTNAFARQKVVQCARQYGVVCVGIVLDLPLDICIQRATLRPDRHIPEDVVRSQHESLRGAVAGLPSEGFDAVYVLRWEREMDEAAVVIVEPGTGTSP